MFVHINTSDFYEFETKNYIFENNSQSTSVQNFIQLKTTGDAGGFYLADYICGSQWELG